MPLEKNPYIIVVIPAFNEENCIEGVIRKIQESYITKTGNRDYRVDIIVVDDGSTDKTAVIAKRAGVKKVIMYPKNRGLGASTRTGLQRAYEMGADAAVKIDADFQHDPDDIDKVVRPVIDDKADCVFGTRLTGGLKYRMPFMRSSGNKFFSWLVSKLTDLKITDSQTGLMAFHNRYLKVFNMISDYNATQQLIMDAYSRHMRIIEVPVVFYKRKTGKSFISWKYPLEVIPTIICLFVQISPLRVFVPLGLISVIAGISLAVSIAINGVCFFGDATVSIFIVGGIQIILFGLLASSMSTKR